MSRVRERVVLEKRVTIERGYEERPRTLQRSFTTEPKIRRRVRRGSRVVYRRAREIVESFNPEALVSYDAVRMRMMTEFGLCDQKTHLTYLGRPQQVKTERMEHEVRYLKSGTVTNKVHTFRRRLPARKGYLEIFGFATLVVDRSGKPWFRLHHMKQETLIQEDVKIPHHSRSNDSLPPLTPLSESEGSDRKGSIDDFSLPLYAVQQTNAKAGVGEVENREERETIKGERNRSGESVSQLGNESVLRPEEARILRLAKDPGG